MVQRVSLPVAIVGAGPVGLAAAAQVLDRGMEPIIFESGPTTGAGVLKWGHVRLFSPWRYVVDDAARRLLELVGWSSPDGETYPTGREIVEQYLHPLAALDPIARSLRLNTEVTSITRAGLDLMSDPGRADAPFQIRTKSTDGKEESWLVRAVIDASGTIARPNPAGADGVPAIGEHEAADRIFYGIPDVLGGERDRYAGKRVAVVGSGHSAFNALLDLVDLTADQPATEVTWVVRKPATRQTNLFGGGISDALPARGELGARVRRQVEAGRLRMESGFRITRIERTDDGLALVSDDRVLPPVDELIVATGFRPDRSFLTEVRLGLDPAVESPVALAPLIDPNLHSCGSVPPHGAEELRHPESDFYMVGMKSYGRAPTFLMLTGYEQVRSVVAAIDGDWDAARDVRLVLPETGVCSSGILADRGVSCCAPGPDASVEADACCGSAGSGTAPSACCGDSVPQLIQLKKTVGTGACC